MKAKQKLNTSATKYKCHYKSRSQIKKLSNNPGNSPKRGKPRLLGRGSPVKLERQVSYDGLLV
jgi:hypothetical protein